MKEQMALARAAAAQASAILLDQFVEDGQVLSADYKDIKTQADLAAQESILAVLAESGIPIIAEEGEMSRVDAKGLRWVVDPLDGTMNFVRGFPVAAVSIGLWESDRPLLGVVRDIFHGQDYWGIVGEGAWLDGQPIAVSDVDDPGQAILATGFPSGRSYDTESLLGFVQQVQTYKKVRMLGSAAMMLAQVASGRFDAYREDDIYFWDVAAGLAVIKAAGGEFHISAGSSKYQLYVQADNGLLARISSQ